MPQLTLDALFLTKTELSHKLLRELRRVLDPFGYDVVTVLVTDLVPDQRVMHAMNEIAVCSAQPKSQHATTLSPACAHNLYPRSAASAKRAPHRCSRTCGRPTWIAPPRYKSQR